MKGKFDAYVLWTFDQSTARDFTVFEFQEHYCINGYTPLWQLVVDGGDFDARSYQQDKRHGDSNILKTYLKRYLGF